VKTREYTLTLTGWKVTAPEHSCLFCDHCTDIFYDSGGIYHLFCDESLDVQAGAHGQCDAWVSDGSEEEQSDAG